MNPPFPRLQVPRIAPPERALGRTRFLATFLRNPLQVIPRSAYEEDFVAFGSERSPRAWVTSPAILKAVLLDQRERFGKRTQIRLLKPLLGEGVLTSEGAEWRWQRQAVAPMFRPQELAGFVPAFTASALALLERWRRDPPGSAQPIDADMTRATFDVLVATLLPSSNPALAPSIAQSIRALQRAGGWDLLYAAMNLPTWTPRPGMVAQLRTVQRLRAAVGAILAERRGAAGGVHDDLMQRLIAARDPESGQSMPDERLVDNLLTFYLAGHETTAKALMWTLHLLARAPDWSAALEAEVASVTRGAPVAGEHVERLALVQQVLKESMRLYPPVPMMSRQALADTEIDGRAIRAGTSLLMPIYVIHRHARRWEDPDAFDPTRFAPGKESAIPRYQYMPFGAGPRICIGMPFALLEATAMLATFLQHARFEVADAVAPRPVARVTLIAAGGMRLRVWMDRRP